LNTKPRSFREKHGRVFLLGALIFILASLAFSWNGPHQEDQGKPSSQESLLENSTKTAVIDWICLKMNEIKRFRNDLKRFSETI